MNRYMVHLQKNKMTSNFYVLADSKEEAIEEAERLNPDWKVFQRKSPDRKTEMPEVEDLGIWS
jgi:hypothetical protein